MKWYLASRTKHKDYINELIEFLISKNQEISYNWSEKELLSKSEYISMAPVMADDINKAIQHTDIFVLFSDDAGTDMFVELGMMLQQSLYNPSVSIYIVGEYNDRSLMYFHPAIKRVSIIDEVFKQKNIL